MEEQGFVWSAADRWSHFVGTSRYGSPVRRGAFYISSGSSIAAAVCFWHSLSSIHLCYLTLAFFFFFFFLISSRALTERHGAFQYQACWRFKEAKKPWEK